MAVTPLMQQYYEIKKQNPGCILFFRMGDFFELFEDDAVVASKILGLTLTSRNNGASGATPLCGFPHHAADRYVPKMVSAGYRIAICEQVEDPKLAKGIVKRDIVEIISAGTAMDESNLNAKEANYLCAFIPEKDSVSFAIADVTTGYLAACKSSVQAFECEFCRRMPKEVVVPEGTSIPSGVMDLIRSENILVTELPAFLFGEDSAKDVLFTHFKVEALDGLGLDGRVVETQVTGALLQYLMDQKKSELSHFTTLEILNLDDYMTLDPSTLRNLELVRPLNADDISSTLCYVLDFTVTAMGGRNLKEWVSHPLISVDRIKEREDAVEELVNNPVALDELKESLTSILDMERLMGRVGSGRANARDLAGMGRSLSQASKVADVLEGLNSPIFEPMRAALIAARGRGEELLSQFNDDLPLTVREGGMIRAGANAELDAMNEDIKERREWIASLEVRERERLGIPSLKVGYNRVFGYYIEVSNASKDLVPKEYIRKQTLANCERYITEELKEMEGRVLGARDRIVKLEYELFEEIRKKVAACQSRVQQTADAIARLDVWCSFAEVAVRNNYTRPLVNTSGKIILKDSRHPVVEAVSDEQFVPNDVYLDSGENRVAIITGPNMAGKSTYMRQVAIIALMAQCGSFVPVSSAEIGVVDSIFARVGASDDLASGQSTFMVEMNEVAYILENATADSLLVLDEIGRGTSTFDGMSIARAVLEHVADKKKLGAKALFATHYHELTELENSLKGVKNYSVAVKKRGEDITFLRRIVSGGADQSYGIEVAKLAGIPDSVVKRARQILKQLESGKPEATKKKAEVEQTSISFTPPGEAEAIFRLKHLDINNLTPMQAIGVLSELAELAK